MRRLLAGLMALAMMLALVPCAGAEMALPYPAYTVLSVQGLTDAQQALVDMLYAPVMAHQSSIPLPEGTLYADVSAAMQSLTIDYPELFHLDKAYSIRYWESTPHLATHVMPTYRMDADEAGQVRELLYLEARQMVQEFRTPEALHDALLERMWYGGEEWYRHTAQGALLFYQATCEGYAQGISLLYRMAGVPCGVVSGMAVNNAGVREGHSWNIAYLNGYTFIDATWNDQSQQELNTHWYYGLSTGQLSVTHTPDANLDVPFCGEQDNWHLTRRCMVYSMAYMYDAIRHWVREGGTLNVRFTDEAVYRAVVGDMNGFLTGYNESASVEDAFYGAYSWTCSDTQLCLIMQRVDD